jgi:membrane-bound hydrogenase subunit alpha
MALKKDELLTYKIPIGPQHPALKEPANFRVELDGEEIVGAYVKPNYNHRGMERLAEEKTYSQVLVLYERICGICSNVHPMCFAQATEDAMGIEVPERALYIRTIMEELERVHSHLLWAGVGAHELGFDTGLMYIWRDREAVMDILEMISGNRVNYKMITIGGVNRDIDERKVPMLLEALDAYIPQLDLYANAFTKDPTLRARLEGSGILTPKEAKELCVAGPTARASGFDVDVRRDDPHAAYDEFDFEVPVLDDGDNMARVVVRVLELYQSIEILKQALKNLPEGPIQADIEEIPEGEGVGRAEAPRGEDIHYVRSDGSWYPERTKVRAPSYINIPALIPMLIGGTVAEIPITVASIDPCWSCTARVAIVDTNNKTVKNLTYDEIRSNYG